MSDLFNELNLPQGCESLVKEEVLIVKKWNWDYQSCLEFQKKAQEFIQRNRNLKVYIFCNHPHCFTLGRGNERGVEGLVDFEESLSSVIDFPLHKIHRGGGVTFHYPGQWIFYPIVALKESFSLGDLSCWLLKSVKKVLSEEYNITDIITANRLMGVWRNKLKLASIGIGVSKFVTEHGIALNLVYDQKMFDELKKINPCGIRPDTYISADKCDPSTSEDFIESFHQSFLNQVIL